jgi:hypothetical protein
MDLKPLNHRLTRKNFENIEDRLARRHASGRIQVSSETNILFFPFRMPTLRENIHCHGYYSTVYTRRTPPKVERECE